MGNQEDWQLDNGSFGPHSSYDYETKRYNNKIKREKGGNHEEAS